jgi:hypothetical protein
MRVQPQSGKASPFCSFHLHRAQLSRKIPNPSLAPRCRQQHYSSTLIWLVHSSDLIHFICSRCPKYSANFTAREMISESSTLHCMLQVHARHACDKISFTPKHACTDIPYNHHNINILTIISIPRTTVLHFNLRSNNMLSITLIALLNRAIIIFIK